MIELGQKVRDTITGMEGIAIARTQWMYGCIRVTVQPETLKDGLPLNTQTFDEPQLAVVADTPQEEPEPNAGPRPDATRQADPERRV